MNIRLIGHDYRYAVEQMLLTLFPEERPVYTDGETAGDGVSAALTDGTAVCRLTRGGMVREGSCVVRPFTDELTRRREEQRAVKLSFYRAALASGVAKPVWGALTGVKPSKLLAGMLRAGGTVEEFAQQYDVAPERARLCGETARAAIAAKDSLGPHEVCLYIGIPFCPTRCAYCSFVSNGIEKAGRLVEPYLQALIREIHRQAEQCREAGEIPVSVYIGGGTPTTLSAAQLDRLCAELKTAFDLSALREFTVEAGRPDTIFPDKLAVLRSHGVSRLSVNPQTMSDKVLQTIGRRHTADDIRRAVAMVRQAGEFELNMDLIAGLPADTVENFAASVDELIAMGAENITVHTLSIKNGSRLAEHPELLPTAEEVERMLSYAAAGLRAAGYRPYYLYRQKYMSGGFENVGWAQPGTENLYNICMMEELCPVLAMGAGGSAKRPGPDGSVTRSVNPKYPAEYIERMKDI